MRTAFPPFVPVARSAAPAASFAAVLVAALLAAAPSVADPPQPTATLTCPRVSEPGRVRCEVEAKPAPGGAVLKWADAVLVSTPPFITPLRGRVGPADATTREDSVWRWTIALAARSRGAGEVEARVRVVSCVREACAPLEIAVRAPLVVGD